MGFSYGNTPEIATQADAAFGLAALCAAVPDHNRKRADR